jgi:hypothetical protein
MSNLPTKESLIEYYRILLHGDTGITSAEILADITIQKIQEELFKSKEREKLFKQSNNPGYT